MTISQSDINAVRTIIDGLNSRPALSADEAQRRHRAYLERHFDTMLSTGKTYGQVTGAPGTAAKTTDEEEFRARLASIDNDLAEQARIVAEGIEHYFENGERPAPHYAWRIAIILRREQCCDIEADFLEAYSNKFPGAIGGRFKDIADRAPKARALAASTPDA